MSSKHPHPRTVPQIIKFESLHFLVFSNVTHQVNLQTATLQLHCAGTPFESNFTKLIGSRQHRIIGSPDNIV